MKSIRVGLIGLGTVGEGVFNVLQRNSQEIERRAGCLIELVHVARRDTQAAQKIVAGKVKVSADARLVIQDPEVDVVVELMGGTDQARHYVLEAIQARKHVVTANKALLALYGNEILEAARQAGVMVMFEAAVAGGIPIIKTLREGLTANRIEWVAGIINGTTNFILSEMREKNLSFDEVLKQAQALGYAEADPTFDIEGIDAGHKLSIISAMAFGVPVQFAKATVEGISTLSLLDIAYAEQLGYRIKLLGVTKKVQQGIELRVHPCLVPTKCLMANVEGAMNAVMIKGDAVGETLYYGKGAGSLPTASAVVADLIDVARAFYVQPEHRVPALGYAPAAMTQEAVLPIAEVITSYYLRLRVQDKAGVLAQITDIFAQATISIDAVIQRESQSQQEGTAQTDLIILTHHTKEKMMDQALQAMAALPSVMGPIVRIRKEELV